MTAVANRGDTISEGAQKRTYCWEHKNITKVSFLLTLSWSLLAAVLGRALYI